MSETKTVPVNILFLPIITDEDVEMFKDTSLMTLDHQWSQDAVDFACRLNQAAAPNTATDVAPARTDEAVEMLTRSELIAALEMADERIAELEAENEALKRGEFICQKCLLRAEIESQLQWKDSEFERGDF
jgi:hypothetical protein